MGRPKERETNLSHQPISLNRELSECVEVKWIIFKCLFSFIYFLWFN